MTEAVDDYESAGGLASLMEWPRLLGQLLRWWVAHVLPYLFRPWESSLDISDRVPGWREQLVAHRMEACDSPRGRCRVHGWAA